MKTKTKTIPEIVIPKDYDIDEIMDMDDEEGEEPIFMEEVKVRFE